MTNLSVSGWCSMFVVTSPVGLVDDTGSVPLLTGMFLPIEYVAASLSSAMMLGAETTLVLLICESAWNTTP